MLRKSLLVLAAGCAACTGSQGPAGPTGPTGPQGDGGNSIGCPGTAPGQTAGLTATIKISSPANGSFFATGEKPILTVSFANSCGTLSPSDLAQADLFVYGPRSPLNTVTNTDLLNIPYAPFAAYAPLQGFPDGGPPNLVLNADGTVSYTLNAINIVSGGPIPPGQLAGTYTASVWALSPGPAANVSNAIDQAFSLVDFQIGTATVEVLAPGPGDGGQVSATLANSTCFACHQNVAPGGYTYMAHIAPEPPFSNVGDYALDSLPIGSCKSCHNNQGYSPNTLLRKVHGVHRGQNQLAPGVAHPDYGETKADNSLAAYLNVGFPSMPLGGTPGVAVSPDDAMEKNCAACHVNNVWQTNLSRAACGTCHDNVYFAGAPLPDGGIDPQATTGVMNPPTNLGPPLLPDGDLGPCTTDGQCSGLPFGSVLSLAKCDTNPSSPTVGSCLLTTHPLVKADFDANGNSQCGICHAAGTGTFAPVDAVHSITQWQPPVTLDGYKLTNVSVTGASGAGFFNVGDTPVLKFQLLNPMGAPVLTLLTDSSWAGTFLIGGPTSNPQRVYANTSMAPTTTGPDTQGFYTFTPSTSWPASSVGTIGNNPSGGIQVNPTGSYTVWFYWTRTTTPSPPYPGGPKTVKDSVDAQAVVSFGASEPLQARQVVTQAGCGSCHGLSADGFPRLAWHGNARKNAETCSNCHTQNATSSSSGGPPPGPPESSVDFQQMIHQIHFARLLDTPLADDLTEFQQVLSPVDVRACTNCHQSTLTSCSVPTDCSYGQSCMSGTCQNTAWLNPTARACITCHNGSDAQAHAAVNTYTPPAGQPIESCPVCHQPGAAYAVDLMHNITTAYSVNLAYPREPPQ